MTDITRAYFIRTADEDGASAGSSAPSPSQAMQAAPASSPGGGGAGGASPSEGEAARLPERAVPVQFNPLNLQYGLQINNPQPGAQPAATQHVARAEATLEMDLIFDTTPSGDDVRGKTVPVRALAMGAEPGNDGGGAGGGAGGSSAEAGNQPPPKVAFVWGSFRFEGTLTGFRETLDFFSAEGVPLRASVHVSMRGTHNSQAFRPAARNAQAGMLGALATGGLGAGIAAALAELGRRDSRAARDAAGTLGLGSLRGAPAALGNAVALGLRTVAQSNPLGPLGGGLVTGGIGKALGDTFGFGGQSASGSGSGQRARLGAIDFNSKP